MNIKSDKWVHHVVEQYGMTKSFEPDQVREPDGCRIASYGTSSHGYDIRCADEFRTFANINSITVDPKDFDEKSFVDFRGDMYIVLLSSFMLARTAEYLRIPHMVLAVRLGRSTYARYEIIVDITPFEPEWEGYVTLGFSDTAPLLVKIYTGKDHAQVLFFESDEERGILYKDRGGKYQGQHGVTLLRAQFPQSASARSDVSGVVLLTASIRDHSEIPLSRHHH